VSEWSSLFSDIVGSTETAATLGDAAWAELLEQHLPGTRRLFAVGRSTESTSEATQ